MMPILNGNVLVLQYELNPCVDGGNTESQGNTCIQYVDPFLALRYMCSVFSHGLDPLRWIWASFWSSFSKHPQYMIRVRPSYRMYILLFASL